MEYIATVIISVVALIVGGIAGYMLTGQLNRHPREAMAFTAENRKDYCEFYKGLLEND